ncbi:MAG: hypothetical protein JEZ10_07090 [Verrucomicrobia bacterium]|nr:hypothetical protein [Verrucomicrobiota bacterium]
MKLTNVQKRGNTYRFRMRIPEDVQVAFGGKREIIKSLQTSNILEAQSKANLLTAEHNETFKELRERTLNVDGDKNQLIPTAELDRMTREYRQSISSKVAELLPEALSMKRSEMEQEAFLGVTEDLETVDSLLLSEDLAETTLERSFVHYLEPSRSVYAVCLSLSGRDALSEGNLRRIARRVLGTLALGLTKVHGEIQKELVTTQCIFKGKTPFAPLPPLMAPALASTTAPSITPEKASAMLLSEMLAQNLQEKDRTPKSKAQVPPRKFVAKNER